MKVIAVKDDVVRQVYTEIYNPKMDQDRLVITHSNGKVFMKEDYEFLIVEDHVPMKPGEIITDSIRDFDQSHRYSVKDHQVFEKIEEVAEEIKEEIKEALTDNKKETDNNGIS